MILIADSGSTKTQWCLIDERKEQQRFFTQGINPFLQSKEEISAIIKKELLPQLETLNSKLETFFYGAGCSSDENCNRVVDALKENFPGSSIEVRHDLLGAARALCGKEEGIAAILGTGSNSCYYNGKEIKENITALGFILGDEGSGAHMGKKLVAAFIHSRLPKSIHEKFYNEFKFDKNELLNCVYSKPLPNRFLASFAKFIGENCASPLPVRQAGPTPLPEEGGEESFWANLVADCFRDFFDNYICRYPKHRQVKMHCVGSIGFHFKSILRQVADEKKITMGKILKSPMEGLVEYHIVTL